MDSKSAVAHRLWIIAAVTLLVKLVMAQLAPLSQDEAYYALWGVYPALGYTEHPPLIGWLEWPLVALGRAPALVRLPAILGPISVGLGIFWLLRAADERRAGLTATIFLLSPLNLAFFLVTTDTALFVTAFWAAAFLYRGFQGGRLGYFVAGGACLGLAMLSKYFTALHLVALAAVWLLSPKTRRTTGGTLLALASALPFALLTLYWNYTNSWTEVRYPFYRDDHAAFGWDRPLLFLAMNLALALPLGLDWLLRSWPQTRERIRSQPARFFAIWFGVPIAVLALLSLRKSVGAHWMLSFYPMAVPVLAWCVSERGLLRARRRAAAVSGVLLTAVAVYSLAPLSWFYDLRHAQTEQLLKHPHEVLGALEPYLADRRLATVGYGVAAQLEFFGDHGRVVSFGTGSYHGRGVDVITDFRRWDGADVAILCRRESELEGFEEYFDAVTTVEIDVGGTPFWVALADGFSFPRYRDRVLSVIRDRFYDPPAWLPTKSCGFRAKYFPETLAAD